MDINEEKDIVITINNNKYLLVDNFNYNNETIYLFLGETDELYCLKEQDKYIPISDKNKLKDIIINNGLYIDEFLYSPLALNLILGKNNNLYEMDEENKNHLINLYLSYINMLNKHGENIDIEKCRKRLEKLNFYSCEGNHVTSNFGFVAAGVYHPASNTIIIPEDYDDYSTIFHEMTHATGGSKFNLKYTSRWGTMFIEGCTDSTTCKAMYQGQKRSFSCEDLRFDMEGVSNEMGYDQYVPIIRQTEHILGYSFSNEATVGDDSFIKEISMKYGPDLLIKMGYALSWNMFKNVEIEKAQNLLLKRAYNIEIKYLEDDTDVISYLENLRGMAQLRGKSFDGKDEFYEKFYIEKYEQCRKILEKNHYDPCIIDKYRELPHVDFYFTKSLEEAVKDALEELIDGFIFESEIDNTKIFDSNIDINLLKIESSNDKFNNRLLRISYGEDFEPYYFKTRPDGYSIQKESIFIKDNNLDKYKFVSENSEKYYEFIIEKIKEKKENKNNYKGM